MRCSRFFVLMLLAGSLWMQLAIADDVESQLTSEYKGKVLVLRHSYSDRHLRFHFDGALEGNSALGSWTTDGELSVTSIRKNGNLLTISGRRLLLFYDPFLKDFRDILTIDKAEKSANMFDIRHRDHWAKKLEPLEREIEIDLPADSSDMNSISVAMNAVFLAPGESMTNAAPDYWQDLLGHRKHVTQLSGSSEHPVYHKGPGISSPGVAQQFDPQFTDVARQAKYLGTVMMKMVVDINGEATDIQVIQPLGLGLDEQAVAAIRKWKFRPALKDGAPVPVELAIEMDFRL